MGHLIRTGRPLQPLHVDRASKSPRLGSPVEGADGFTHNTVTSRAIRTRRGKSRFSESSPRHRNALRIYRQRLVVAGFRRRFAGNLCTGGGQRRFDGLRLASTDDDDDDSNFSFGLIHTTIAAIGVGALSCLTCIAMILVVRRKKHHKTTSPVEDEEIARRLQAEQLAYETTFMPSRRLLFVLASLLVLAFGDDDADVTLISSIQGSNTESPLLDQVVTIAAVVIGDFSDDDDEDVTRNLNGFFVQEEDADADADPLTSEGIFVFDGNV